MYTAFIKVGSAEYPHDLSGLLNRKAYCITLESNEIPIQADMMYSSKDQKYVLYDPNGGSPLQTKTIATIKIETKFGAQSTSRTSNPLALEYIYQPKIVSVRNELPGFDATGLKITLLPAGSFGSGNGNPSASTGHSAVFTPIEPVVLDLRAGSTAPMQSFVAEFNWSFSAQPGEHDYATFKMMHTGYFYGVQPGKGLTRPNGEPYFVAEGIWSAAAKMPNYTLRCDRNVARRNSKGCVFSEASAVLKLYKSSPMGPNAYEIEEAGRHIYEAQISDAGGGPYYKSQKSPGKFQAMPAMRAIADTRNGPEYTGLEYAHPDSGVNNMNREAACTSATALVKLRGYPKSNFCQANDLSLCQCDEYPFAGTYQGGAYAPNSTSVRYIRTGDNGQAGTLFGSFLIQQRVFPREVGVDPFWVDASAFAY